MPKLYPICLALGGALLASACGSNTDTSEPAQPEATASAGPAAAADNPFAASEQQMSDTMMAAVGADVGDTWALKMIAHHQGAIDMSRQVLAMNPTADVARMAQDTIDKQSKEISDLRKLAKGGNADRASAEPFRQPMMTMQQEMMAATGKDASETYMRKMLAHHRGGVAMSDAALRAGVSGAVRAQVNKTRDGQQKDAEMTQAMLRGEPMASARKAAAPAGSMAPASRSTSSAMSSTRASPAATPSPTAAPDSMAGHDMSSMTPDPTGSDK